MSNAVIALLIALGAAAWIYSKMMRSTGGNTQSVLVVAGISGALIFMFVFFIANALL